MNYMHDILLVDDDPRILDKVISDIQAANLEYNLTTAENGQEGVIALRKLLKEGKSVKLVITDFEMPIMNGLEMVGELKSSPTLKNIPILMLTSVNDKARVILAIQKGITNYCVKPWNKEELIEKITFCLEKA